VSDSSTNLRAAAIVKPRREAALKLLHGTAFRAPSAYELDYYENPQPLVPETIRTTEVVWEQYVRNKLRLSASWFHYHADDLISQIAVEEVDTIPFENVPGASASGLELEVEGVWRAYQGLASYSYERARNEIDRSELTNSPRHLLRARFTGPVIPRRLFVGVETLYTGDRQTLQQTTANGALIGNVTLSSADIGPFGLSLTVGNLLDRRYGDPGAVEHVQDVIPQDGRTARVKLSWRF
jgi:iron complex outermembrane receptor protein